MIFIRDKQANAASAPLLDFKGSDLFIAWSLFETVKTPFPIGIDWLIDKSDKALADSLATIWKWYVSPLITQPKATKPSNNGFFRDLSETNLIAGAISKAPGTFKILKSIELDVKTFEAPSIRLSVIFL